MINDLKVAVDEDEPARCRIQVAPPRHRLPPPRLELLDPDAQTRPGRQDGHELGDEPGQSSSAAPDATAPAS